MRDFQTRSDTRAVALPDLRGELRPPPAPAFEPGSFEAIAARAPRLSADDAYAQGLAEGERRGRDEAVKELVPVIAELREIARALGSVRSRRLAELERELVDLACELARRVLHGELALGGDAVARLARALIEAAADEERLVLRCAPSDVDLLRAHATELELDLADGGVQLAPDATLAPGNVVLETARRCYDARPERVLAAARAKSRVEGRA
jgi:flagellar assembly protein FliH